MDSVEEITMINYKHDIANAKSYEERLQLIRTVTNEINSGNLNVYNFPWSEMFDDWTFDYVVDIFKAVDLEFLDDVHEAIVISMSSVGSDPVYQDYTYYSPELLKEKIDNLYKDLKKGKEGEIAYKKKLLQRKAKKEKKPVEEEPLVATDVNLDEIEITVGPYKITKGKQRDFIKVIWVLKELKYFEKRENGGYATNRTDVITQFIDNDKLRVDNEISKALKTESFMNVFDDMQQKASELYDARG